VLVLVAITQTFLCQHHGSISARRHCFNSVTEVAYTATTNEPRIPWRVKRAEVHYEFVFKVTGRQAGSIRSSHLRAL
jgi:hypothetical protein